jgi:Bacterial pre-peptidase C-terminal domain
MKPVLRSMALLAAVGIFGCKSDPSGVTPDDTPVKIVANPAVLTVAQGASKTVTIAVVDSNGNAIPAEITAVAGSADITVVPDTSAELVYGPDGVPHTNTSTRAARFTVTANNLNAATITVTSGALTTTLPVVVTPTALAAVQATNEGLITLTAPAGLTFAEASKVTITKSTTDTATLGSVLSTDGSTLTFLPLEGLTDQPFAVRGVIPSYAPTLLVNLDATTTLTTGTNSADLTTAPALPVPASGQSYTIVGVPPFEWAGCVGDLGDNCDVYKITVTAPTTFHVTLNWDNTSDLGIYFFDSSGNLDTSVGAADAAGAPTPGPEEGDITLPAGTWYMGVLRFTYAGSTSDPNYYTVTLTGL